MRAAINQQLTESGEKEKLKAMIRERLRDHGWADNLKQYTKGPCDGNDFEMIVGGGGQHPFRFKALSLRVARTRLACNGSSPARL